MRDLKLWKNGLHRAGAVLVFPIILIWFMLGVLMTASFAAFAILIMDSKDAWRRAVEMFSVMWDVNNED